VFAPCLFCVQCDAWLWRGLYGDLIRGIPSIVCTHYSDNPAATEHFRLVVGYEAAGDLVVYNEPAEDAGQYRTMKRDAFIKLWPLKYDARQWTAVRMRLEAGAALCVKEEERTPNAER